MKYLLVALPLFAVAFATSAANAKEHKFYPRGEDRQMSANHAGPLSPNPFYSGGRASWDQSPTTTEPAWGASANGS